MYPSPNSLNANILHNHNKRAKIRKLTLIQYPSQSHRPYSNFASYTITGLLLVLNPGSHVAFDCHISGFLSSETQPHFFFAFYGLNTFSRVLASSLFVDYPSIWIDRSVLL